MNISRFILRIHNTERGFSVEIYERDNQAIEQIHVTTSHFIATKVFQETLSNISSKWFKLKILKLERSNTFAEFEAIQQFVPEKV